MKFLVVLAVAVACACADVSHVVHSHDADAHVVKYENEIKPNGEFKYGYEVSNGISHVAEAVFKNGQNVETPVLEETGQFRYPGPDGKEYIVNYVANEKGFQPTGDHLPQTPEAIQRSLAYNAAHPQFESKNENYLRVAPAPVQTAYKPTPPVYKPFQKKF